jgi:hypothetical protein
MQSSTLYADISVGSVDFGSGFSMQREPPRTTGIFIMVGRRFNFFRLRCCGYALHSFAKIPIFLETLSLPPTIEQLALHWNIEYAYFESLPNFENLQMFS